MTLQQLKYVTTIANIGSISEAAKRLFVSQPSLTKAIKELEKEMGITIFDRTNKGITVSKEGERFLGYARQVLEQAALLEEQYKSQSGGKKQFSVSTQHYSFAVNAFVELLKGAGIDQYDVSLRETQTYEIIDDVAHMKSEIGLLFYNDFNRPVLEKLIHTNELTFTELFTSHHYESHRRLLGDSEGRGALRVQPPPDSTGAPGGAGPGRERLCDCGGVYPGVRRGFPKIGRKLNGNGEMVRPGLTTVRFG